VVVVADDPGSLRLSEQNLLAAGYWNLRLLTDPGQIMGLLQPLTVDLVICDVQMPDIEGVLKQIRDTVPADEYLPVLVVTADAGTETKHKALRLGADDFLAKPIDVVEMALRVKHLLELRILHSALSVARSELESEVEERTRELETAMEHLGNLVKAKDLFIASVSHELRTPLTAVLGFAEELARNHNGFSRDEMAGTARMIAAQAADLSAIIDDLLVAARSDINTVHVLVEVVDLSSEISTVLQGFHENDRMRVQFPTGQLRVRADHLRVRQILRNLINNALRHGGRDISLELCIGAELGTITVIDDGPGLPAETLERLFEPYFHGQGDSGQPGSIGLGLSVSRFLARLMNGDIRVVTRPEGTAFELSLPAA
jgi:signal transduction histidine kinase